jgi:TRAP-type C4-dicarboxylate transport system permease small subunit
VRLVATAFGALASVFLAGMMLLTVADVVLRAVFKYPIHGTFELIELGLACTVFFALPAVFLRDENLVVDAIDYMVRPAVVRVLDLAGACASLALLTIMALQMVPLARDMYELGDVTSDLSLPKIYYWIPVLTGVVGSAIAAAVFIARWRSKR